MSDESIRAHAATASDSLQQLQTLLQRSERDDGKVRFPRGYLVDIKTWRARVPWTQHYAVGKNVAYTLMLYDVQSWLLKRTDIAGLARDMVVKACVASLGWAAEALLVDATSPPLGARQKLKSRVEHLSQKHVVSADLAAELLWLWDMRYRQHLQELSEREFEVYRPRDVGRAEAAVFALCAALPQTPP